MDTLKKISAGTEASGKPSSIRQNMRICTVAAVGLAFYGLYQGVDLTSLGILCGLFLGAGVGGKVFQKGKEPLA